MRTTITLEKEILDDLIKETRDKRQKTKIKLLPLKRSLRNS